MKFYCDPRPVIVTVEGPEEALRYLTAYVHEPSGNVTKHFPIPEEHNTMQVRIQAAVEALLVIVDKLALRRDLKEALLK